MALLLLAGCQKTPKGQVIAIVNGDEISIEQLSAEIRDIAVPDSMDRTQLRKAILQGLIDRHLEVEEARKRGLDKTPEFVLLKKRNEEELLASLLGEKVAATVPMPVDTEIRDYIYANPLQFARRQRLFMDQLAFAPPKNRASLSVLADAHSMDEAVAALQSIGIVPARGQGVIDTGQTEPGVARQLDEAPEGEPILLPQGDRLIVGVITRREPIAMPPAESRLAAGLAVRGATLLRESQAQVAAARSTAKISYEPGYEPEKAPAAK
ncbi:hypothetical protein WP12_17180 [Sphingomonas sp. SRS2]|nr:hypothetical protein WP12_17180 [Sphingomonas sp. SRS2]